MRLVAGIITVALTAAFVWIVLTTAWMWRYQERVVFQPPSSAPDAPRPARKVEFPAADGHPLFGYVLSPPPETAPPKTIVIVFHGNADLAAWQVPWAQELVRRTGVTVFAPEYRGYAGIPGSPSYASSRSDAAGALAYARSLAPDAEIVLYGHSLGSAIATELAASMKPQPPKSLILVSPFTSARDMASRIMVLTIPWLWDRVTRVHYDTHRLVREMPNAVHVAHGSRDLNIPVRMGRQVHAAARRPGELLIVDGAGHNDVPDVAGERYWKWLAHAVTASP